MTDVTDLLQQHGAPLPNAVEMETEIRSEGAVAFPTLHIPHWAAKLLSSSILAEWRCTLGHDDVDALQALLKSVLPSGRPAQQAINEAFQTLDIGTYLGTFVEQGVLIDGAATVRVLFAYRSDKFNRIEQFNQAIYGFLTTPGVLQEASDAYKKVREFWQQGSNKWEGGLIMLSEVNRYDPGQFPFTRAKLAARTGNP